MIGQPTQPRPLGQWGSQGKRADEFDQPTGVAFDNGGQHVLVADSGNGRVTKWSVFGEYVGTVMGPSTGLDVEPVAVAVDAVGTVYMLDGQGHRVLRASR